MRGVSQRVRFTAGLAALCALLAGGPALAEEKADPTVLAPAFQRFLADLDLDLASAEDRLRDAGEARRSDARAVVATLSRIRSDYGDRRLEELKEWLRKHGVTCKQLETISFGEEQPAAPLSSESCWALNRRAQAVLGP